MTTLEQRATEHAAFVRRLLDLTDRETLRKAILDSFEPSFTRRPPVVGHVALIGVPDKPYLGVITKITPTRVTVSHFTTSGLSVGRHRSSYYPEVRMDDWPNQIRRNATPHRAALAYEEAVIKQTVYRAVTHCPWIAFVNIRNTTIPIADVVVIPEED